MDRFMKTFSANVELVIERFVLDQVLVVLSPRKRVFFWCFCPTRVHLWLWPWRSAGTWYSHLQRWLISLGSCCRLMGLPDEFDLSETVASVVGSTVCD